MSVRLEKASVKDAPLLWQMQVRAFKPLLEKYRDGAANPASEPLETVERRFSQSCTDYYLILLGDRAVGGVRVIRRRDRRCNISPLFVVPEYQRRGIAQAAIRELEEIYPDVQWELNTILQEKGNCRLYEKMGYRRTGELEQVNEYMTLVYYRKRRRSDFNY